MNIIKIFQYLSQNTNIPVKNEQYNYSNAAIELKKHNAVLLKNPDSRPLSETEYYFTLQLLLNSVELEHIQFIFRLFELIRNQSAQVKSNQEQFVESGIWKRSIQIIELISDPPAIRMGIQMLNNLMTDNHTTQKVLWPHIIASKLLLIGLTSNDPKTLKSTLIGIYNCTHNDSQSARLLFESSNANAILNSILKVSHEYVNDDQDICFELSIAILTGFLELDKLAESWEGIQDIQLQICLLKVLDGIFHSESDLQDLKMPNTGMFLIKELKNSVGTVEQVQDFTQVDKSINNTLLLAFYILQYWCIISERIPQDSDILCESLSYVLQVLEKISPKVDLKQNNQSMVNHPLYKFKYHTIKIISNLVFNNRDYQKKFQPVLPIILSNCQIDDLNPYVREISVFCIRNMLQDNKENQELIDGMEAVGIEDNLQEFGVEARLENGKIKIRQNK